MPCAHCGAEFSDENPSQFVGKNRLDWYAHGQKSKCSDRKGCERRVKKLTRSGISTPKSINKATK